MVAIVRGNIRVSCPECRADHWIGHEDLGQELLCDACRTSYVILRGKRRHRMPRTRRSLELEEAACGPARPPRRSLWRACIILLVAFVATAIISLVALNFTFIVDGANDLIRDIREEKPAK